MESRSKNTIRNAAIALAMQIVSVVLSFIGRTVFALLLEKEYLGLGGLFSNIISVLSLSELGIGSVIIVNLYKPLAEKDQDRICKLMNFYRTAYQIIGIFVICCGIAIVPFLPFLVNSKTEIPFLKGYFILFIVHSASSYFFAYKQSILIASQKEYICSIVRQIFNAVMHILQIIFLIATREYVTYLLVTIFTNLATNIVISMIVDRKYPYLKNNHQTLQKEERKKILANISSMMLHKVGNVIINSTDNILISSMVGIIFAGLYSNYLLIINTIMQIVTIAFNSVSASIGDFNACKSNEESMELFKAMNILSYWIFGMSSICLITLFQPTISIWLGTDYLLNTSCVMMIVINFFLSGIIRVPATFVDVNGLYTRTKFKPITMALLNLVISIACAKLWGLIGIFIGTFGSYILVGLWVDPFFLCKYKFLMSFTRYVLYLLKNVLLIVVFGVITYTIVSFIRNYILKVAICFILSNLLLAIVYCRTDGFQFIYHRIRNIMRIRKKG